MSDEIDWSKPIEAVRISDGQVFPVTFYSGPDDRGYYYTNECPNSSETNSIWRVDGSDVCEKNRWCVRNRATETPSDTVTVKRMTRKEAGQLWRNSTDFVHALHTLGIIREETPLEAFKRQHPQWELMPRDELLAAALESK